MIMKFLEISDNKAYFRNSSNEFLLIDQIGKDDLLYLIDKAVDSSIDFDMDDLDNARLANEAHNIIYSNIYGKLKELIKERARFSDEYASLYRDVKEKYGLEE